MASRDFGLVKYQFKRADGKGRVFTAFQTPSALIRATRNDTANPFEAGALMAYYAADAAGVLGQMKADLPDDGDLDRALALFDVYQFREVPIDDDGRPVEPDGDADPDPTGPRRRASAS